MVYHIFTGIRRNQEGYGEDPFLSGEMAFANVRGLQGHGLPGYPNYALAAAGCKHFSAFDGPENNGNASITDEDWFWNYMPQFECVLLHVHATAYTAY
jgi:beta-glucosidase